MSKRTEIEMLNIAGDVYVEYVQSRGYYQVRVIDLAVKGGSSLLNDAIPFETEAYRQALTRANERLNWYRKATQ